jgi:hypothetical protein
VRQIGPVTALGIGADGGEQIGRVMRAVERLDPAEASGHRRLRR